MTISSPAYEQNQKIPQKFSCDGQDINPPFIITDVPENTQSLVLIFDDPDAPAGLWTHWTLWNIDPKTTEIAENSVPPGAIEGITTSNKPGYHGPCPPSGTHRYIFHLFALDIKLDIPSNSKVDELKKALKDHVIDQCNFEGLYSRDH